MQRTKHRYAMSSKVTLNQRSSHVARIAYQTARTDLLPLEGDGFLAKGKRRNKLAFATSAKLRDRAMGPL